MQLQGLPTEQQKADLDLINKGYMRYSDGVVRPYPGGPADPAGHGATSAGVGLRCGGRHRGAGVHPRGDQRPDPRYPDPGQYEQWFQSQYGRPSGTPAPPATPGAPAAVGAAGGPPATTAPNPAATAGGAPAPAAPPQAAPGVTIGGVPVMTPEQEQISKAYGDQAAENVAAANKAPDILGRVQVLRSAANTFSDSTYGGMGPTAPDRLAMASKFADLANQFGVTVSKSLQDMISSGQIIGKEQGQLTAELVRQLGSREASQIYTATQNYTPGVTMSRGGYNAIVSSIEQGAQRDIDKAAFQDRWLADPSHHNSVGGMVTAFNEAHPIETYSSKVAPIPVSQAGGKYIPGAIYLNGNGTRALRTPDGHWQQVQ